MLSLVDHVISNKIVPLPDNYEFIGEICGVKKLDATQPVPSTYERVSSIKDLTKNGTCRRVSLVLSNNRLKTVYMIPANFGEIKQLVGLTYDGLTIKKAYFSGTFNF